ncbi:right-handed parallel beta-helix repeat-containing protein [Paenibacillus roseipurpureus]|uniref:Right-handed parallel beta-helix repeat-containing protein n=1 Tax=Paenibacillus roseopurpureus TaxID=2918901 RepID=A0AA96LNI5_9BACL|nr:right-handed parallel beta-helix repeat-containing protein [Paenibacillus sp. MBLB1832]WNR43796.1 right-handed parallel beta-helix repeat-containing protein [Paenibacillus sp. MBLB1832]
MIRAYLKDLDDVNLTSKLPVTNDVLTYDGTLATWVPKQPVISAPTYASASYIIDLNKWGIKNDGTNSAATTKGINDALSWAKAQGITHCVMPSGTYLLKMDSTTYACILMPSGMHLEMADGCKMQLETNSSPWYSIFYLKGVNDSIISGGTIIGDKKTHVYQLGIKFVRGGVNADGSLNSNPNFIRSQTIDRYSNPGLLQLFRLWSIPGVTTTGYSFYQYKDTVSAATLAGSRNNGQFAPAAPTGRGWFADIANANKMIFAIDITSSPLTDAQIAQINAKVDAQNYTHEWGHGIQLLGANNVQILDVDISNCTGDGVVTTWLEYKLNPSDYTQEQMGSFITVHNCNLHHCRRQGISLIGSTDVTVSNNKIHHIGYADDGVTEDGISPMFGIDIESMWSETNIPTWRPELNQSGLELNTRIYIKDNYISDNRRGHFVNADGINIVVENNTFSGYNVGGISSYPNNMYVKYVNNTFMGCELVVKGDNFLCGAVFNNANLTIADVSGAVITNCQIKNGAFTGSALTGYFGTPTVNVAASTFTYGAEHGMGNGAKIVFEQWLGKVPTGISVDKLYYTVSVTPTSFKVSESANGAAITLTDAGTTGFNISRYNYGRFYISDIVVERDWRADNSLSKNFSLLVSGGVIRNIAVKNYELEIVSPANYVGRPIIIDGVTVIEGGANFESCELSNSSFLRIKTGILGGDINLGTTDAQYTRKVLVDQCMFQNVGVNYNGNVTNNRSTFLKANIGKSDNMNAAVITNSYLEDSNINMHWLTHANSMTIARSIFRNVATDVNANTRMLDNLVI